MENLSRVRKEELEPLFLFCFRLHCIFGPFLLCFVFFLNFLILSLREEKSVSSGTVRCAAGTRGKANHDGNGGDTQGFWTTAPVHVQSSANEFTPTPTRKGDWAR